MSIRSNFELLKGAYAIIDGISKENIDLNTWRNEAKGASRIFALARRVQLAAPLESALPLDCRQGLVAPLHIHCNRGRVSSINVPEKAFEFLYLFLAYVVPDLEDREVRPIDLTPVVCQEARTHAGPFAPRHADVYDLLSLLVFLGLLIKDIKATNTARNLDKARSLPIFERIFEHEAGTFRHTDILANPTLFFGASLLFTACVGRTLLSSQL